MGHVSTLSESDFIAVTGTSSAEAAGAISDLLTQVLLPGMEYLMFSSIVFIVGWVLFNKFRNFGHG